MNKIIGYALALIGLVGLALSTPFGKKLAPFMNGVDQTSFLIGSLAFVIAGILVISLVGRGIKKKTKGKGDHGEEVPIYKGDKVVGYRRH